jgi:hypothetical protein
MVFCCGRQRPLPVVTLAMHAWQANRGIHRDVMTLRHCGDTWSTMDMQVEDAKQPRLDTTAAIHATAYEPYGTAQGSQSCAADDMQVAELAADTEMYNKEVKVLFGVSLTAPQSSLLWRRAGAAGRAAANGRRWQHL